MNPRMKRLLLFVILTGSVCSTVYVFRSLSPPEPAGPETLFFESLEEFYRIQSITIQYKHEVFSPEPYESYTYKITKSGQAYHETTGKDVDPLLIRMFVNSFTDFYESDTYERYYEDYIMTDYYPHFIVTVTLETGNSLTLETESNYHCHIPWNIQYNNKRYVQYNGKIPSALFKILAAIDEEEWSLDSRITQWGCYPAPVPEKYRAKGMSDDFPQSPPGESPEEIKGSTHVLWEVDTRESITDSPYYVDGTVFVTTEEKIIAFDARTGEKIWDSICGPLVGNICFADRSVFASTEEKIIAFDVKTGEKIWEFPLQVSDSFYNGKNLIVHGGAVYAGTPEPSVCRLDAESGNLDWRYLLEKRARTLEMSGDNIFAVGQGITCLDADTGQKIWGITMIVYNEEFYHDKIVVWGKNTDGDKYCALVDIESGDIIWKGMDDDNPFTAYYDGTLYYNICAESRVVSVNTSSMEEGWSYTYEKNLGHIEVFEDGVCLLLFDADEKVLTKFVYLDKNGSKVWESSLIEKEIYWYYLAAHVEMVEDTLFFIHVGTIYAFDARTGKHLWDYEVQGIPVRSFELYGKRIYVSADDCRFYCLSLTGVLVWVYEIDEEFKYFFLGFHQYVYPSEIVDNMIFIASTEGNICALSLVEP